MKLTRITIYPIKSIGGIALQSSVVETKGLKFDRRMMLVNKEGKFITQREYSALTFLSCKMDSIDKICVFDSRNPLRKIEIDMSLAEEKHNVVVWDDQVIAYSMNNDYDRFFSEFLGLDCFLVSMKNDAGRKTQGNGNATDVSFADGYPYLLVGENSLALLNSKLDTPVSMSRFRPNLVFEGGGAFEEDDWGFVKIGDVKLQVVKKCARCNVTTINPETGMAAKEPLKTMATFRTENNQVNFGVNAISIDSGLIKIGDEVLPL